MKMVFFYLNTAVANGDGISKRSWSEEELRNILESMRFELVEKIDLGKSARKNWVVFILRKTNFCFSVRLALRQGGRLEL